MSTVRVRNINPLGQVDLRLLRREGDPLGEEGRGCLEPGEVFDVPAELAGRPPQLDDDGNLAVDDDGQVIDAGEGLLAQHGNYELADAPARRKPRKAAEQRDEQPPDDTHADNAGDDVKEA